MSRIVGEMSSCCATRRNAELGECGPGGKRAAGHHITERVRVTGIRHDGRVIARNHEERVFEPRLVLDCFEELLQRVVRESDGLADRRSATSGSGPDTEPARCAADASKA